MRARLTARSGALSILLVAFGLGLGCAGITHLSIGPNWPGYDYFTPPAPDDAWTPKIAGWQARERAEEDVVLPSRVPSPPGVAQAAEQASGTPAPVVSTRSGGDLRSQYFAFRADRKRRMARAFAEWIQSRAQQYYVADGPIDHWATFEETLQADGDDCDGLELLAFHGLRDLGFDAHEVYRAIVFRRTDGQHHMVTLWFEDPTDPWVLDPTGAMVRGMSRMSDLPQWVPLKVFSESLEYTVRPRSSEPDASAVASAR